MTQQVAYTIAEAGKQLGLNKSKAYELVKKGVIDTFTIPETSERRVPHFVIEQLVRETFNAQNSKGDQQ